MNEILYSTSDGGIKLIEDYKHKLTNKNIGEWNLWGRLREVIVGTPKGMIIPEYNPSLEGIVAPDLLEIIKKHGGEFLSEVLPEFYQSLDDESKALANAYTSNGVKVHIPRDMRAEEIAYSFGNGATNVFPCDPFWCVGRNIIETSWRRLIGNPHRWAVREIFLPYIDADPSVLFHACPMPSPGNYPNSGDFYFEVGDMLNVGDGNIILAYDKAGTSSNPRGCEWAKRILEADGFKVTTIVLPDTGILHLYAVICIIAPGVVIAYEDAFPGRKLPEPLSGWEAVWCNYEEAKAAAPCAVNIDRNTVLLPRAAPKVCEAVSNRGFKVIDIDFSAHAKMAGGIRCDTGVIYREIDG